MSTEAHNLRFVDAADRTGLYTVRLWCRCWFRFLCQCVFFYFQKVHVIFRQTIEVTFMIDGVPFTLILRTKLVVCQNIRLLQFYHCHPATFSLILFRDLFIQCLVWIKPVCTCHNDTTVGVTMHYM